MASATISNVRTNDIFTNVLIQHGRKALNKENMESTRSDQLHYFGKLSGTRVEHCEEIFVGATNEERSPKRILLTGKAGIGKTLFCQKLVRDWADEKLFQSQSHFKFVYLLTFRQLNLLENGQLSLQELLNCSTVLDNSSNIDDSLFEYIVNHPEEVLIIIDGYDEYSQQDYIAGRSKESEVQYPAGAKEKMPVATLCSKLIKRSLLRDSVVMITSRPDESDKMGGIPFDRYMEIAGFSPEQVQEFIEKYFRENNTMKKTVLHHVMKNEDLVSFAHIPMLCFLMCFSMEYALQTSKSTDDLPVSATGIYSEVVNIFELKHSAASEYRTKVIPEEFSASHLAESTLNNLSELAAKLLLEKKPIFQERDMEDKFCLVEIEKLKGSGLLHCGPPFRKSLLETTKYLSFTHLTLHEFLAARWFVMRNVIPNDVSGMVLQFIAGILSKKKNDELMKNLLESISFSSHSDNLQVLLRAKCLSEYQDKEFAKNVIKNHPHHYSQNGELSFDNLNDVDCIAISFLLDVFTALNEEQATTAQHQRSEQSFTVTSSYVTLSGLKRVVESLEKESCSVTILHFIVVPLTKCVDCISGLVCSKLKELCMVNSRITDDDFASLCDALKHPSCKVTTLNLRANQITDTGVTSLCDALKHPSCKVTTLDLRGNQITDTGVTSLCDALKHPSCKVSTLDLGANQITHTGVTSLCGALKHPSSKVTTLDLSSTQITDTGVTSLCGALKHPSCKVTTLDLSGNQITDTGVTSLCDALKHPSCKVTTLGLSLNQITDTGVTSLCDSLKHPSCKVTTLNLGDQITDTGVTSLCDALKHPSCKVTTLDLSYNQITDTGVTSVCDTLTHPSCKVSALDLGGNQITDTGVTSLCDALKHPSCKVTTLNLSGNQITDTGVTSLCEALQHDNCKLVKLDLMFNGRISEESEQSLRNLVKQHRPGFELEVQIATRKHMK